MKLADKFNRLVHPSMIRYVCRSNNKKMAWCEKRHPELFKPIDAEFAGQKHPYFEKMKEGARRYAAKVQNMNMFSWDILADKNGDVKILGGNAASQSEP